MKNFAPNFCNISIEEWMREYKNGHQCLKIAPYMQKQNWQKQNQRKNNLYALFSGVSLLPILAACDGNVVNFDGGEVAPKAPDVGQKIDDLDNTFRQEDVEKGVEGTSQEDILPAGLLPRDEGSIKLASSYGGGADVAYGLGITEPGQYIAADLENVAATPMEFSQILRLNQAYNFAESDAVYTTVNANRLSTIVAGDSIDGGSGIDSLYLYGQHDFYALEEKGQANPFTGELFSAYKEIHTALEDIENVYLHGATLSVSARSLRDLSQLKIQGDGKSILWIKTPVDVERSNENNRFIPRKYEDSSEEQTYKRFQLSAIEELTNYIVDLRDADLSGINRLHIDAGTAIILRLDVEDQDGSARVEGVLKDVSMITGRGAIVFDPIGSLEVPNLENLWISKEIEVIIAAREDGNLASRDSSRGGSNEIEDSNLIDTVVNGKPFLKLGMQVEGSNADDTMVGSEGDDALSGNAGADLLSGGGGDDTLDGGIGRDQIISGLGQDTILGQPSSLNADVLQDFSFTDRIKITGNYNIADVSARIQDEGGERRILVDTTGDSNPNFYMVLARPTENENRISYQDRVYNFTDTHFHVIGDFGGVVLVPTKFQDRDPNTNQKPEKGLVYLEGPYAIKENEFGGLVARIKAIDADRPIDGNGRHGYRLIEDNRGFHEKFTISSTGELRLKSDASFDFEADRLINIFIEVFDNPSPNGEATENSLKEEQTIQIFIEDVNEAPEFEQFTRANSTIGAESSIRDDGDVAHVTIVENTTFVLKFPKAQDPDLQGSVYYQLEGRNSDVFLLDSLKQTISFKEPVDYELRPGQAYEIRLIAVDAGGLRATKEIEVTVEDVNEAPVAVDPLPVQWVIIGDDSFDQILGIETIFQDPEYEELRRLDDTSNPKTLTYSYVEKETGRSLPWLSQPEDDGAQRYGMKVDMNQVEALYGGEDSIYEEFEIEIRARDQGGLVGTSDVKIVLSNNKPPISQQDSVSTDLFLVENGSLDERIKEDREAAVRFLEGIRDPEGHAIKIRTTIPILDANGNQERDASGNDLFQQIYWGNYGYLVIRDVDLTLNRAGGTQPSSQYYSYYLVSQTEDVVRAKQFVKELQDIIEATADTNPQTVDQSLINVDDAFFDAIVEQVNSLSQGERVEEEISIDVEDYGLTGDRSTPSSYIEKKVLLNVDGTNDSPERQGELLFTVREPRDAFTEPETSNDPSAEATGGIGALMENVRDVDTKDVLEAAAGSLPERGVGTLEVSADGSFVFTANHNKDTDTTPSRVDRLAEGEVLTHIYRVQINDGKGGAVTNEVKIEIIGRNDVPVFNQEVLINASYQGQSFEELRFSQGSFHEFALPEGAFLDVDESDTLTYSYIARLQQGTGVESQFEIVDISDWFALDSTTGRIYISNPPGPPSGTDADYRIAITASDGRATVEGVLDFVIYRNLPPFHQVNEPGSGYSESSPARLGGSRKVFDLTPQEERDIDQPPPIGTTRHKTSGEAFELLLGIEDTTQVSEAELIRVEADDPLDQKFQNLDVVPGTYVGKYGTLVINPKEGEQQTYTYTLDYDGALTNQLERNENALGAEAEAIEIQIRDRGGLSQSHWISLLIEGINDAPESSGEQVYIVSENIGSSSPLFNPLENVSDPDGDVDISTQATDTVYIWSVLSEETGNVVSFESLVNRVDSQTYNIRSATFRIDGRYGVLEVQRKIESAADGTNALINVTYDAKYIISDNSIAVEKLSLGDTLQERFIFTVADGVLPEQQDAYSAEQELLVQISGEDDQAEIFTIPELRIELGSDYSLDLDSYVQDPDSTKIYRLERVTKDGTTISRPDFFTQAGQFIGELTNVDTNNLLSFLPNAQADIGSYTLVFSTSNVIDPDQTLEGEELLVRLDVVGTQSSIPAPAPLDFTGEAVLESNEILFTEKVLDYFAEDNTNTYRPAQGRYTGTYGYIEVIRGDQPANDSVIYYLDNLDPDTDALAQDQEEQDIILLDVELLDTNQPRVQREINVLVGGINDEPVVFSSASLTVNLAADETSANINRAILARGVEDADSTNLTYEFVDFPANTTRLQGTYGYISAEGGDNYRYVVNPFGDTDRARARLVKALQQGETVEERFQIRVSDGIDEAFQTLTTRVIGKNDDPEVIKQDQNNNIIMRFLQGESAEKALTGEYVVDPDGDEIQYRQIGNVEKDGVVFTETSFVFDANTGVVRITGDAESGEYTFRVLIQNPFALPIDADGNLVRVVVSDALRDNLDLLDTPLTTQAGRRLEVLEGLDGADSTPIVINASTLIETKPERFGFNPRPVEIENVRTLYGKFSIDEFTGNLIYILDNTNPDVNKLDRNEELIDSITYEVVDDYGTRDTREIQIAIIGENDSTIVELRNLEQEGFVIEQNHNSNADRIVLDALFQSIGVEVSDPEKEDDFNGKELILTVNAEIGVDTSLLSGFRFLLPADILATGRVTVSNRYDNLDVDGVNYVRISGDEARFRFSDGTTKVNMINLLNSLRFYLESSFLEDANGQLLDGNGYVTSGTNARFEGLSLNVNVADGSSDSVNRLLDAAGVELTDGTQILEDIPLTVTLQGFNRFVFDGVDNFNRTITPNGLSIGFDGENYQHDRLIVGNGGKDANPFEIVSLDTDGDNIPDRFMLRSRDIGGTEYIERTLKSGELLSDAATKFTVSIKDTQVTDVRHFEVTYAPLPSPTERAIITQEEIQVDSNGDVNILTEAEQADDVSDLSWSGGGSLDRYRIFTGGGADNLYDHNLGGGLASNLTGLFAFSNTIFMGAGRDEVFGAAGNDDLHGGSGADTLRGGLGDDNLIGGRDSDVYEWSTQGTDVALHDIISVQAGGSAALDKVIGFSIVANDRIDLSRVTFKDSSGTDLTGQGSVLAGINYIRLAPGAGTAPTRIFLDINGDGVDDQIIEFWDGEIGTALGLEVTESALTPNLLVPAFGKDILLPDVFAYATLNLTPRIFNPENMERLQVLDVSASMSNTGSFNFGTNQPNFEILGADKDLFTVNGGRILMDAVASVETTQENYLLLVKGEQQTNTGEIATAYGTLEVNFTSLPSGYVVHTAGDDKVLTPNRVITSNTALDHILFEGDDVFGTAYKGVERAINAKNNIYGGAGSDAIYTGDGNDSLYGGSGDDTLWSGLGDDLVSGGSGNDVLVLVGGENDVDGGMGDDTIWLSSPLWKRENDREVLSTDIRETSVMLGEGADVLRLFRGGSISVNIEDETFESGDVIDLSHYIVLPNTGSSKPNLSRYVQIDTTGTGITLFIDKEGLGHFTQPSRNGGPYEADARIQIDGKLENGILTNQNGDPLNLGLKIGTQTYDLSSVRSTSAVQSLSAFLRDDGNGNYSLFVGFSDTINFGNVQDWQWQMNLRSAIDDSSLKSFTTIGNDRFYKPQPSDELPQGMEADKTLSWGFTSQQDLQSLSAIKLDIVALSQTNVNFATISDLRVSFADAELPDIEAQDIESPLIWGLDANDATKNAANPEWDVAITVLKDQLSLRYEILGQYSDLFVYENGQIKRSSTVFDLAELDNMPRELHLTLVAYNERGAETRADFIIERALPSLTIAPSYDEPVDEVWLMGMQEVQDFDAF